MKKNFKITICLTLVTFLLFSATSSLALQMTKESITKDSESNFLEGNIIIEPQEGVEDYDPLVDIEITFTVHEIRAFDEIDFLSKPDFYVKVFVNGVEYVSPLWRNKNYVKNANWSFTADIPDNKERTDIKIELWDKNFGKDRLCDISGDRGLFSEGKEVNLLYSIKTGHWFGDDMVNQFLFWDDRGDHSGYGRLCGCDDGSIYQKDLDCELWFDITQNDYDGDGITYWMETNVYNTDPEIDNTGEDDDEDGVPIEWEYKWGHKSEYNRHHQRWEEGFIYDPNTWENHSSLDPDEDGLDNIEEYKAEKEGFRTEPYRKDILLEIDQMEEGPNGEGGTVPELSKDLLIDSFGRHNIVFQIDDQGRNIEFNPDNTNYTELQDIYFEYFMNNNESWWRRGAFHYAPIIYRAKGAAGFMWHSIGNPSEWDRTWDFSEDKNNNVSIYGDCFLVTTNHHDKKPYKNPIGNIIVHKTFNKSKQRAIIYASAMMHETGHVLGIYNANIEGCDNSAKIWEKDFWTILPYHSCMNYQWMYQFVDYSDGSNGKYDHDDWANLRLSKFQEELNTNEKD